MRTIPLYNSVCDTTHVSPGVTKRLAQCVSPLLYNSALDNALLSHNALLNCLSRYSLLSYTPS